MQTIPAVFPRVDFLFFDLVRCLNELHNLRFELSKQDLDQIELCCKKLFNLFKDR